MSKQHKKSDETQESVSTAVASLDPTGREVTSLGLSIDDLAADAGAGRQGVTATDMATPIISILQSNSPQCKKSDAKYISGATEGQFFNNVTGEVYDGEKGLKVIPCFFEKVYIEWKPNRGGLVGIHDAKTPLKDQIKMVKNSEGKEIPTLPSGNTLTETNQHYVLIVFENGTFEPAVISMASTALKSSRLWNTLMGRVIKTDSSGKVFTPATYLNTYRLVTKARQKDSYSWFTWAIEPAGEVTSRGMYEAGKALEQAVSQGKVKVKQEEVDAHVPAEAASDKDEEVPF